ncbi:MAG TPA: hypothetical protein P5149_00215 [Candidatus Competibacteraceae bacterium]|nr:hypothetical protein [Candidatus Competibacteraceae bacterium]MCP5132093.1 hypothetical protein [Gammaproteobacteria bacterium]HPF58936.1 hypothetical protein [Candidatus Competibacteraceae bacterium]HRY16800.1 hypothetical protein [Candidatus Competibacteraceae bacterium]
MTEHDDKQATRVDTVASVAPSKGRRRLVKGAMLTVPAIMTLRNGAAWAAPSHQCDPTGFEDDGTPIYSAACMTSLGLSNGN